jgi:thiol-disulfide isomerase/thioredoxin
MKKHSLTLVACLLTLCGYSQTPQEVVAKMIRSKLGENCVIKDTNGKQVTFEFAAEQTIGASMLGKRIKYDPLKVIEGVSHEVMMRMLDPSATKPTIEEIDFPNTGLGFYNEAKQKISASDFKSTVQSNAGLIAAAYNANNGIVSDYYIIPKPKPASVQISSNGDGTATATTTASSSPFSIGKRLPEFKMADINGKKWSSKELKDKIVVMNFWFVECPPCIAEMPSLNKLVEKYRNNDKVVFLSVANTDKEKIKSFLVKKEFKYAHIAREQSKNYLSDWGINAYPQNVVVNRGMIGFSFSGGTNTNDDFMFTMLSEEIEKCLKG